MHLNYKCISALILTLILALAGCKGGVDTPVDTPEKPNLQTAKDFFPVLNDSILSFHGEGNEYAAFNVFVEFSQGNRFQQRIDNGGTVVRRVLKVEENQVTEVFFEGESYWRINSLEQESNGTKILLTSPIEVGNKWIQEKDVWSEITAVDLKIETKAGTFQAIEVTTQHEGSSLKQYFCEEVGLIKQIFESEGMIVLSELAQIETGASIQERIRLYYPGFDQFEIFYVDVQMPLYSNERLEDVLTKTYRNKPDQELGVVLGKTTRIQEIVFLESGEIRADLNEAFLSEMNAGAAYEGLILQSLVNTLADYFQSQKVILTINGKLYESGHFMLEEGFSFEGRLEEAIEWTP